jgi:hypothetical protein
MSEAPTQAPLTRKDIEAKVVALAWQDDAFRRKFVADPKRQFEERLGIKLPQSLTMTAHGETGNSLHFVIPAKPPVNLDELSDEELERVAGGTDISVIAAVAGMVIFAAGTAAIASMTTAGLEGAAGPVGKELSR